MSIHYSVAGQNEVSKEQALDLDNPLTGIPALPCWLCDLGEIA